MIKTLTQTGNAELTSFDDGKTGSVVPKIIVHPPHEQI
ncbi:hypothetical protein A343_0893 [Porphyromonas gingivalis JCVI SC001]|nr:hypothetical protein A343_0893 [Porphyromonas gingivalis JCVI SC001]